MTNLSSPLWNKKISTTKFSLVRRKPEHVDFLIQLWQQPEFLHHFNRLQGNWSNPDKLRSKLKKENETPVKVTRSCHWIIEIPNKGPEGILSLVDISDVHRRAEVLIGVGNEASYKTGTGAMLLCFQFFFHTMKYEKLMSFIYPDNIHSIKSTLALGFKQEAMLRSHLVDPANNQRHDLIQTGILRNEAFNPRNQQLAKRLLA